MLSKNNCELVFCRTKFISSIISQVNFPVHTLVLLSPRIVLDIYWKLIENKVESGNWDVVILVLLGWNLMNFEATRPTYSTQRCCNLQIALQEEVNSCLLNTKLQKEKSIFIPPLIQSSPPSWQNIANMMINDPKFAKFEIIIKCLIL